jgi:hypothetical protein
VKNSRFTAEIISKRKQLSGYRARTRARAAEDGREVHGLRPQPLTLHPGVCVRPASASKSAYRRHDARDRRASSAEGQSPLRAA